MSFGRGKPCQIKCGSYYNSPISKLHCNIIRDEKKNIIMLEDLSSNGTYIAGRKIGRNNRVPLTHGTTFYLKNRDTPQKDQIGFLFQLTDHDLLGGLRKKYEFTNAKNLGTGGYAIVKEGINLSTRELVAIKEMSKPYMIKNGIRPTEVLKEVELMYELDHVNVIKLYDHYQTNEQLWLVLEKATGGDLFDQILNNGAFSEDRARRIFKQLVSGVKYLHSRRVIHRDLKPENILMTREGADDIKIADFGLSKMLATGFSRTHSLVGTNQYAAPEVHDNIGTHI